MNIKAALKSARARIEKPENWCQFAPFRDKDGDFCLRMRDAESMCALAACIVTTDNLDVLNELVKHVPPEYVNVSGYNDSHTHSEVLALFDKAIAAQV